MHSRQSLVITLFLSFSALHATAQKVGVVLSGGGASAMAHVGVLKALEENSIPIDYITGTSSGAMVGALYASGYSPAEIELLVTSDYFNRISRGQTDDKYLYYFRKHQPNASWVSLRLSSDSTFLQTSIPTSFISPAMLDLELMFLCEPAAVVAGYNFDSLFVPFRCVAADIEYKETVLFSKGNLNSAIRASMSYPLYLEPLLVDGKLLFDGGLYNNFPTDVMRDSFAPDVIIGSNVSSNEDPPREGDAISQLRNMVVSKTNYELPKECCVLIEPRVEYGTFDFRHPAENIDSGYVATLRQMDEIKAKVHRRVHEKVLAEKRTQFNRKKLPLEFKQFQMTGLTKAQQAYVGLVIRPKKNKSLGVEALRKNYFKLYESEKIKHIFPTTSGIAPDSTYILKLAFKKEKDLLVELGGNIATRLVGGGFVGVGYGNITRFGGVSAYANTHFGRFYSAALGSMRLDLPIRLPMYIEMNGAWNWFNYFNSRTSYLISETSSYLVQKERFFRGDMAYGLSNKTKLLLSAGGLSLTDEYYSSQSFGRDDLRDISIFSGSTFSASIEQNSLNQKLYPTAGAAIVLQGRFTTGAEVYNPGTTSLIATHQYRKHEWFEGRLTYDQYYLTKGPLSLGLYAEGVYSTLGLFTNYTATQLRAPAFQPTPESKLLFLESFRAFQYAAIGHKFIVSIYRGLNLRLEGYVLQPYRYVDRYQPGIDLNGNGTSADDFDYRMSQDLKFRYVLATANLVYNSRLGPVSFSTNYYHNVPEVSGDPNVNPRTPLTFLLHFGYILFNDRALK